MILYNWINILGNSIIGGVRQRKIQIYHILMWWERDVYNNTLHFAGKLVLVLPHLHPTFLSMTATEQKSSSCFWLVSQKQCICHQHVSTVWWPYQNSFKFIKLALIEKEKLILLTDNCFMCEVYFINNLTNKCLGVYWIFGKVKIRRYCIRHFYIIIYFRSLYL